MPPKRKRGGQDTWSKTPGREAPQPNRSLVVALRIPKGWIPTTFAATKSFTAVAQDKAAQNQALETVHSSGLNGATHPNDAPVASSPIFAGTPQSEGLYASTNVETPMTDITMNGAGNAISDPGTMELVDVAMKDTIQTLYEIQSATHGYRPETTTELIRQISVLTDSLSNLSAITAPLGAPGSTTTKAIQEVELPPEILDYVDGSRNPDIYNREFVEVVQRGNANLKGKADAFASFSDIFAEELKAAKPECAHEVDRILSATGRNVSNGQSGPSTEAGGTGGGNTQLGGQ